MINPSNENLASPFANSLGTGANSIRFQVDAKGQPVLPSPGIVRTSAAAPQQEAYYPMAEFEMPDFGAFLEAMGSNQIDFGSIYAKQAEESANAQGLAQVSALYSAKFDAADKAITEVNQQVADEMAHARLVGLDYSVDEASKQARINDIFANYWSEADEGKLSGLIKQYGNAGYDWDLPVKRGKSKADAAKEKTPGDSAGKAIAAKTRGAKLTTEENPLGSSSVLG